MSRKTAILEHWFAIDKILFGDKDYKKVLNDSEKVKTYNASKAALLSNLYEIYSVVDYDPKFKIKSTQELVESAGTKSKIVLSKAKETLLKENVRTLVQEEIKQVSDNMNLSEATIARNVISKRRDAVAIDILLYESAVDNSNRDKLNSWEGRVLVDAHKTLRDSVIASAHA